MKATWVPEDEYSSLYESAEWQDKLSAPRGIISGLVIVGWLVFVWVFAKVTRYF